MRLARARLSVWGCACKPNSSSGPTIHHRTITLYLYNANERDDYISVIGFMQQIAAFVSRCCAASFLVDLANSFIDISSALLHVLCLHPGGIRDSNIRSLVFIQSFNIVKKNRCLASKLLSTST